MPRATQCIGSGIRLAIPREHLRFWLPRLDIHPDVIDSAALLIVGWALCARGLLARSVGQADIDAGWLFREQALGLDAH
jgi:hypothetical protein